MQIHTCFELDKFSVAGYCILSLETFFFSRLIPQIYLLKC